MDTVTVHFHGAKIGAKNSLCPCIVIWQTEGTWSINRRIYCKKCFFQHCLIKNFYINIAKTYPNLTIKSPFEDEIIILPDGKKLEVIFDRSECGYEMAFRDGYWNDEPLEWWVPHLKSLTLSD